MARATDVTHAPRGGGHQPPLFLLAIAAAVAVVGSACRSVDGKDNASVAAADVAVSAPIDDVVPVLVELVSAHNAGPEALERVLLDRFGSRAARQGRSVVVAGADAPAPLALVFSTTALPRCADPRAGVVVGEPAAVLGCGAQALAGLATFVVAAERQAGLRLILDAGDEVPLRARRAWGAPGGVIVRGGQDADAGAIADVFADTAVIANDAAVFDIDAVTAGVVVMTVRRADDDAEALAVDVGRALAWRSTPRLPLVLAERFGRVPRTIFGQLQDPAERLAAQPATVDQVVERCRLEDREPSLRSGIVAVWCQVLPGREAKAVRDDVVRAIGDPGVSVVVVDSRAATATRFEDPLVQTLARRLHHELPSIVLAPQLVVGRRDDACGRARRQGIPCVAATPLALQRPELARRGGADDAVDVGELARAAARVADVTQTLLASPP